MTWVKLDDHTNEHVKMLAAGPEAAWLWTCGLMYCNRQKRRDGIIPSDMVPSLYAKFTPRRARALAEDLVNAGLWERIAAGFLVHDYHDFQPRSDDGTLSEKRKAAGSLGGKAKAANRAATKPASNLAENHRDGSGAVLGSRSRGSPEGGGIILRFPRQAKRNRTEGKDVDLLDDDGFMVDAWLDEMKIRTGVSVWNRMSYSRGPLRNLAFAIAAVAASQSPPVIDRCALARGLAAEFHEAKRGGQTLSIFTFIEWLGNGRRDGPKKGPILQGHDQTTAPSWRKDRSGA